MDNIGQTNSQNTKQPVTLIRTSSSQQVSCWSPQRGPCGPIPMCCKLFHATRACVREKFPGSTSTHVLARITVTTWGERSTSKAFPYTPLLWARTRTHRADEHLRRHDFHAPHACLGGMYFVGVRATRPNPWDSSGGVGGGPSPIRYHPPSPASQWPTGPRDQ